MKHDIYNAAMGAHHRMTSTVHQLNFLNISNVVYCGREIDGEWRNTNDDLLIRLNKSYI